MVTSGNKHSILAWLVLVILTGCGVGDIKRSFLSDHANRLLSADASKTWRLISRSTAGESVASSCLAENTITFVKASTSDSLYILGRSVGCTSSDAIDTLYKAKYALDADTEGLFLQTVTLTEEKHGTVGSLNVGDLTSDLLKISYTVDGEAREEQYAN